MKFDFSKFLEIILAAALTFFVALGFRLSDQIDELTKTNVEVKERIYNLIKTIDRHELEIEKIKVELLTIERNLTQKIYELRIECHNWMKKANDRIDQLPN